ncbi:MAG: hypothetical protein EOP86_21455, partial [Verrucomicrobiaceae bacterium]
MRLPPAEAAVQTTTPPARRKSRWRKRLAWFFGGLALIICGLGLGGWLGRVSLVNRLFSARDSVWKIHVESIELQGGKLLLTGLKVNHTDQKEAVFQFAGATTNASWSDLRAGQLGDLVVEDPVVFWRKGLRSDPWKPATGLAPLFTWRSIKVSRGQADLRSGNDWSLTTGVDGVAGAGTYLNDGRISVASGSLQFKDPVYAMTLEGAPVPGFSVKAGQVSLGGALDSENGLLSLHDAALAGTELEVISALTADHAQSPPPPAPAALPAERNPANSSVNHSGSNPVRGVSVSNLSAPGTSLKAAAPWKITANTDLSLRRFLWQSGQPGTAQGIQLARSSLTLAGVLRIPLFRLEGNLTIRGPQLSLLKLAGAEILNLENLLEPLGIAPDSLPSGTAKLDAEFKDIDFFEGRLISSSSQILTLHDSDLTLPEMGTVKIAKILMEGVPDEILKNRRLKRLEVESPDLALDSPPGIASKPDLFLPRPGSAPKPERPAWEGWTADSLTINNGKLALTLPPPSAVK